jgi:hypothetical protein
MFLLAKNNGDWCLMREAHQACSAKPSSPVNPLCLGSPSASRFLIATCFFVAREGCVSY